MKRLQQIKLLLVCGFLFICISAKAQEAGTFQLLPSVSQSSYLNPAVRNKTNDLVISIPFLSGTAFSYNPNFPLDALFSNGLWNYSFFDFYDRLPDFGKGQASARLSMFYASFNYYDYTFSVSYADRAYATTRFDRNIVKLIRDGVQPYYNNDQNFGSGSFRFNHFKELSFGISYQYWEGFDLGIRPKILFGGTYFDAQDISFSVETDEENEILNLKPEGTFDLSAPLTYRHDSVFDYTLFSSNFFPFDYSFSFRNLGFGLDAGAVFSPNKFYEFSVSVLDFGFTGFKHNTFEVEFTEPVQYDQESFYQSHTPGVDNYVESREALRAFGDSVSYIIHVKDKNERVFNFLPIKLNLSGKYNMSESLSIGLSNRFSFYRRHSINVTSGFLHKSFEKTTLGASVSAYNFSTLWVGFGASYTAEHFQYYISSENILGIIQPASTKHLNLSFGINFLFSTLKK